jgi:hypothetical protein
VSWALAVWISTCPFSVACGMIVRPARGILPQDLRLESSWLGYLRARAVTMTGIKFAPYGTDVRFDLLVCNRSRSLTAVKAIILPSCIKRHIERLATTVSAVFNRRIEQ